MIPKSSRLQYRLRNGRTVGAMTLGVTLAVGLLTPAFAQQVAPPESEAKVLDSSAADPRLRESETAERVVLLTPFEVSADDSDGYRASSSLAGTRLKMDLANIGSAISVLTEEFIADVGATAALVAEGLPFASVGERLGAEWVLGGSFQHSVNPDVDEDLIVSVGAMSAGGFTDHIKQFPAEKLLVVSGDRPTIQLPPSVSSSFAIDRSGQNFPPS